MRNEVSVALVLAGLPATGWGQVHQTTVRLSGVTETAFTYFQQVEGHRFDEFLRRLRPARLSPDAKERVLKQLPQTDVVSASAGQQAKLHTLAPILRYHERESAIDVKVLRVGGATAVIPGRGGHPHHRARARGPLVPGVAGHCRSRAGTRVFLG